MDCIFAPWGEAGEEQMGEMREKVREYLDPLSSSIFILPEEAPWLSLLPLSSANSFVLSLRKRNE